MNWLDNPLVIEFLDDMVEVGLETWGAGLVMALLIGWGLWGTTFIPLVELIVIALVLNMLMATTVTAWWQYRGREKHTGVSIVDLGKATTGRDTE